MRSIKMTPSLTLAGLATCAGALLGCSGSSAPDPETSAGAGGHSGSGIAGGTGGRSNVGGDASGSAASSPATPGGCVDMTPAVATPCGTIANDATPVSLTTSLAEPPAPSGGVVASGTYFLTSATWYSKDANCNEFEDAFQLQIQTTIVIDASASRVESVSYACALGIGMGGSGRSQGSFMTSAVGNGGTQAWPFHYSSNSQAGCSPDFTYTGGSFSYSASNTSLTLIAKERISACNQAPYTYVEVYAKQ